MRLAHYRMSRRGVLRSLAVGGTGLVAIPLVGCGDDDDDDDEPEATATSPADEPTEPAGPTELALVDGWFRDAAVRYYDFGMNSPASGNIVSTAPIWAFITGMDADGNPQFVDGQHNVIDVVPGDDGYSDLWEVHLVVVPDGYEPDSIKSREEVEAAGYEEMVPGLFVNCPVVAEGTTLEGGEELVQGWYKGDPVFYPDFGGNPPAAVPIWAFITGMDADGNPQFVDGQHNIIDTVPGDTGYSAFWRVNLVTVPDGYEPDSVKSAADVRSGDFTITETDLVVNCPGGRVLASVSQPAR